METRVRFTPFVRSFLSTSGEEVKCMFGMVKMGNTKYSTSWGDLSAKAILGKLSSSKQIRYSRRYRIHYAMTDVKLAHGRPVCSSAGAAKLRDGEYCSLPIHRWFHERIRNLRHALGYWSFFADSKRLLGLAYCPARDFTAQLAHVSLVMIRHNLLVSLKRSLDYETIGKFFKNVMQEYTNWLL